MKKKEVIPITHKLIYQKLFERYKHEPIKRMDALQIVKAYRIQKKYCDLVIKEMENLNMIKVIGFNKGLKIILGKNNFNLDNTSKIYHDLGLWE